MEKGYTRRAWNKLREETIEKGDHTGKEERYTERWNIYEDDANTEGRLNGEGTILKRDYIERGDIRRGSYTEKGEQIGN